MTPPFSVPVFGPVGDDAATGRLVRHPRAQPRLPFLPEERWRGGGEGQAEEWRGGERTQVHQTAGRGPSETDRRESDVPAHPGRRSCCHGTLDADRDRIYKPPWSEYKVVLYHWPLHNARVMIETSFIRSCRWSNVNQVLFVLMKYPYCFWDFTDLKNMNMCLSLQTTNVNCCMY